MSKIAYICAPYRPNNTTTEENIKYAVNRARGISKIFNIKVIIPHTITFNLFGLNTTDPELDKKITILDDYLLLKSDVLFVCGTTISSGMMHEIELAKKNNIPVFYYD